MDKLLPCPFCGQNQHERVEIGFIGYCFSEDLNRVARRCIKCGASAKFVDGDTQNPETYRMADEAWNTRYEQPKAEPVFACASAPVLKDERVEAAYRKGRFDERLQQQIFASAV